MELRRYGRGGVAGVRGLLLDVHDAVYADDPDPFHSRERFTHFLDLWSSRKNWQCVVGREGGDAVGYAYGSLLAPGGWWKGSVRGREVRGAVFALSELMVLPEWQGTGRARRIHDALIAPVAADLVSLQVETGHPKVVRLYESWGYRSVDEYDAGDGSPPYTVMVKRLSGGR